MPQQEPRKVTSVPEGYAPEIRDGKTVYVKKTTNPGRQTPASSTPRPKPTASKSANKPGNFRPPRPNRTLPTETEDIVYLEDPGGNIPKPTTTSLYGGVDVNRRMLPKTSVNQPYDAWQYPDETGNYSNKSITKYSLPTGEEINAPTAESYSTGKFVPSIISGSKINEGANVGGVTRIMQPKDSGVNKEGISTELLMPGTTANKNTFGGAPVSDVKKVENIQTTFETPQYDKEGKKTDYITSPKFAKGGTIKAPKMKGYLNGGPVEDENYNPNNPYSGVVQIGGQGQQFTPTGNTNQGNEFYGAYGAVGSNPNAYSNGKSPKAPKQKTEKQQKNEANARATANAAGQALGAFGSSYYNSQTPTSEGDATRNAGLAATSQSGPIGGAIGGIAAIGDKIGKPIKERSEQRSSTGDVDESTAKRNAVIGTMFSPSKRLTYKGGLTDVSGKAYISHLEDKSKAQLYEAQAENVAARQQQALAAREEGDVDPKLVNKYNLGNNKFDAEGNLILNQNPNYTGYNKGGIVGKLKQKYANGGTIKGKGGPKDDAIIAKVEEDSFVVPAENADKAEIIRKVVLKAPNMKANLKQKGGENVKLSDGEHLFTPEEKDHLMSVGIDLNKLAPEAEESKMHEKIEGEYKKGGEVKDPKIFIPSGELEAKIKKERLDRRKELLNEYADLKQKADTGTAVNRTIYNKRLGEIGSEVASIEKQYGIKKGSPISDKKDEVKTGKTTTGGVKAPKLKLPSDIKQGEQMQPINVTNQPLNQPVKEDDLELKGANTEINQEGYKAPEYTPKQRKGIADYLGKNFDPTMLGGVFQTAAGLNMLKGVKRPEDKAVLDADYNASVERAKREAQFGFTPEAKFGAEQDLQNALNDARFSARNLAGGNAGMALNQERAAINQGWRNKLGLRTQDQELQLAKQQYAGQAVKERAGIVDLYRRRAFGDAMNAFTDKQEAGSELIGAGLRNTIGAYRYNRELENREAERQQQNQWLGTIAALGK